MAVLRANVDEAFRIADARLGNDYVYSGTWSQSNVHQGADCSAVWADILSIAVGRLKWGRESEGATTESYRYIPVGGTGPFGTIIVARPQDIPADAAAKLAFHHGPGGGAASHMWGELDGERYESGGSKGFVTKPDAWPIDHPYANAWAYLPGPIVGARSALRRGDSGSDVAALQAKLNELGADLEVDGDFGELTAGAVAAFQRNSAISPADGVAAEATLKALRLPVGSVITPAPPVLLTDADRVALAFVIEGRRRNITPRGIQITIATGLVESNLKIYANTKVPASMAIPHTAVGNDGFSVGPLQQQVVWGDNGWWWGDAKTCMDPATSSGLFYDRLARYNGQPRPKPQAPLPDYNDSRISPGWFAAEIQQPDERYRGRYDERFGEAVDIYNRLTAAAPELDPWEELIMSGIKVKSISIYATPGEPDIDIVDMIRALDAHGGHEAYVENRARAGDLDSIRRVARTAVGLGQYGTAIGPVTQAVSVLNEIQTAHPEWIVAATPGKASA